MITTTDDRKKKAVAYIRISSSRQIDNESPDTQRQKIQEYADSNGIEIIKDGWFFDEAKSGKNAEREELKNLLKFALNHRDKIDHVLVYKMSRASRDITSYYMQIKGVLMGKGITLRSATEQFDDSSTGRFMELIYVGLAQMDNDNKREYTLDNMKSLARQGYYQHPPTVGYDTCKVSNAGGKPRPSLKMNEMAPKVKKVLERFGVGDVTKAELTRYAAEIGLRTRYGSIMVEESINRLLHNPVYTGSICDSFTNNEIVPGKHDAIISMETFERNKLILDGPKSRKDQIHLKKNPEFVLKGTLICQGCEKRMYASAPRTGNGGRSPRYHCGRCRKTPSVLSRVVHEEFEAMLKTIKPTPGTLRLYKEVLIREANNQLGRINSDIKAVRIELDEIASLRVKAVEKYTAGDLSKADKDALFDALDVRKAEAMDKLLDLEEEQNFRESDIEYAINFMENVDKQWADADFDMQQRFQNLIFPNGIMYDSKNHRFGTSKISPLYQSLSIQKLPGHKPGSSKIHLVAASGLEPLTFGL